jgi:protein-L-isoaspartate(D-aspartate) O-methyltransferase
MEGGDEIEVTIHCEKSLGRIAAAALAASLLLAAQSSPVPAGEADFSSRREAMVAGDIERRGIRSENVLKAMRAVPRHLFVPRGLRSRAYQDRPLPIGRGQTISQPYVVALMTDALQLDSDDRVLEIGTGSGYQAAVLAEVAGEVYSLEIIPELAAGAAANLKAAGYGGVATRAGDGYYGWPQMGPFDAIIVTAAANHVPPSLIAQLRTGGRLILPLGSTTYVQTLTLLTKTKEKVLVDQMGGVRFVPMVGEAQKPFADSDAPR